MVDFDEERDFVGVFSRDRTEHAECRGDGIAAAFKGQLDDILGIKIHRILGKTRPGRVLDPLVHRKDRHIPRPGKPAGIINPVQVVQNPLVPVGRCKNPVHKIRPGQMNKVLGNRLARVSEQVIGLVAEVGGDVLFHRWESRHSIL